jgi:hypothetical protein
MNNLFDFYKSVEDFANRHRMVRVFKLVNSVEDIEAINVDHRSFFLSLDSTDISRDNNFVSIGFTAVVMDKALSNDSDSVIISSQENIFVINEIQDFILLLGNDVEFEQVFIAQNSSSDYNVTAAICEFTVYFDRTVYCASSESLNIEQ